MAMAEALCGKCEELFTDPRILPCLHTFCLKCLEKFSETTNEPPQCPTCEEKVALPTGGVQALPKDQRRAHDADKARLNEKIESGEEKCDQCLRSDSGTAVAFCIQCSEFLCEACRDHHRSWRKAQNHELIPTGERLEKGDEASVLSKYRPQPVLCSAHQGKEVTHYCKQCKTLICLLCRDSKVHKSHNDQCVLIDELAVEEMESLKVSLGSSQSAVAKLDGAIDSCRKTTEEVKSRKKAVDEMITSSLEEVRQTLLRQNSTICDKKVGSLESQEKKLVRIRNGLAHTSVLIKDSSLYTPEQQLSTKGEIAIRAEKLLQQFRRQALNPLENDRFCTQIGQKSVINEMVTLGQVSGWVNAASSTFESSIPHQVYTSREYTMQITARDERGLAVGSGGTGIEAKLLPQSGVVSACRCTDNHNGTFTIQYTATASGYHELHVTIAGCPIKNSPRKFTVTQSRLYSTLSCQYNLNSRSSPYDVAAGADGTLAVAEYGYHTVSLYNKFLSRSFYLGTGNGTANSGGGYFSHPSGVAIKGDTLYVTETGNNRVQTFSISTRQFQKKFGSSGSGNVQFSSPRGICIGPKGKIFVADYNNHRIQVFDSDHNYQYSITGNENKIKPVSTTLPWIPSEIKFQNPWGIAFDLEGNLHIAANGSNCIVVYTPMGAYVTTYGSGTINKPAGIAINGEGVIAISEYGEKNQLWIYNYDRKKILKTIEGAFSYGVGIACDSENVFWAADYGNSRVLNF